MQLTRRQFLRLFSASATGAVVSSVYHPALVRALEAGKDGKPAVIWLQGAGCNGCSVSLLNTVHPKIAEVLLQIISLRFHPTVMAGTGKTAFDVIEETATAHKGNFVLVLEGGIPTADNGNFCYIGERDGYHVSILEEVTRLAPDAGALVAVGTCATYGGIPAAKPNPTNVKGLAEVTGKTVINVSGCPAHPDWIVGTLAHVLLFGMPELTKDSRPALFYAKNLHENCPYYSYYANGNLAQNIGEEKCLAQVGCKGPLAFADCPQRRWNSGVNWCIGSGTGCIACCEPGFPDSASPLYANLPEQSNPRRIV